MPRLFHATLLLLALSSAAQAEDQDYSHRVCSLEHPQLEAATYTSQGMDTGCSWTIKGGGSLSLTIRDSELDTGVEQSRQMLSQIQETYKQHPEVTVKRAELGVCKSDEYLELSAPGDASGLAWARCDDLMLVLIFAGPEGLGVAKAMASAARDAKW